MDRSISEQGLLDPSSAVSLTSMLHQQPLPPPQGLAVPTHVPPLPTAGAPVGASAPQAAPPIALMPLQPHNLGHYAYYSHPQAQTAPTITHPPLASTPVMATGQPPGLTTGIVSDRYDFLLIHEIVITF